MIANPSAILDQRLPMPATSNHPETAPMPPPEVDLDHPNADLYQATCVLLAQPLTKSQGIGIMWDLVDDTEFMIQVCLWLCQQEQAKEHFSRSWKSWCIRGHRRLFAALDYGIRFNHLEMVLGGSITNHQMGLFLDIAPQWTVGGTPAQRLMVTCISHGFVEGIVWLFDQYPQYSKELIDAAIEKGRVQDDVVVWEAIISKCRVRFQSDVQCRKIQSALIRTSWVHGVLGPDQVAMLLYERIKEDALWEEMGNLISEPELARSLAKYQGLIRADFLKLIKDAKYDDAKKLLNKIADVHSEQEDLFAQYLKLKDTSRAREFLRWFIQEHQIDLLARSGEFLLDPANNFRSILVECTQKTEIRYCLGHMMRCVLSKHPLPFYSCEEYQIDHVYMYSNCIQYQVVNAITSLCYSGPAMPPNPDCAGVQDQTDQSGPKVELIWLRYPDQVHSICLPNFLLAILQSDFGSRAKSARSSEILK